MENVLPAVGANGGHLIKGNVSVHQLFAGACGDIGDQRPQKEIPVGAWGFGQCDRAVTLSAEDSRIFENAAVGKLLIQIVGKQPGGASVHTVLQGQQFRGGFANKEVGDICLFLRQQEAVFLQEFSTYTGEIPSSSAISPTVLAVSRTQ
jgi:hypothetical protein